MGKNFEGGTEIRFEDIGAIPKEGINIDAATMHIEAHQGKVLDREGLAETNRILHDLSELQNDYPESSEIQNAIALLRNIVSKSEKVLKDAVQSGESSQAVNPEKLLKELEGHMNPSNN